MVGNDSDVVSDDEVAADGADDPAAALYECGFSVRTIATETGRGVKAVRRVLLDAGIPLRPPGAATQVSGSAVAALPPGPAADIARRVLDEQAESRRRSRPWDPPSGDAAWRAVLLSALGQPRAGGRERRRA